MRTIAARGFGFLLFFGLLGGVACGSNDDSSGALGTGGAGRSGDASYPCDGPENASAGSGGQAGETGQASSALSCVVGQSFCYVFAGRAIDPRIGTIYMPACRTLSGSLTKCAATPSCACFCSQFDCAADCRCSEVNGFATVTCQQI